MNKLKIFIVALVYYILNRWISRIPSHYIRNYFIKKFLSNFGRDSTVLMDFEIRSGHNISIGSNTIINQKVLLDGRGGLLIIGNNVDIAQESNIWTLEHNVNSDIYASEGSDVIIEDYVWIASRVTVLPGVIIHRGAVVASGSVVTKNVPPNTIVGGIPAKKIGMRGSDLTYSLEYKPLFR